MIKAVFFDMNQTMLNMDLLKEQFDQHFDDQYVLKYWFSKLLHSSTIMGIMGDYKNFGELAAVALENLFFENKKELTEEVKNEILGVFKRLPAYDDVRPAIRMLKERNIRAIAVSNSSLVMIEEQLSHAGILDLFDKYYSVDQVMMYKPFEDIYLHAVKAEGLRPEEILMVATHDWDLYGAKKAGLQTAYVKRKEELYHPLYMEPDYRAASITSLLQIALG